MVALPPRSGVGSSQAAELHAAALAALECSRNPTRFVNDCETVLGRFDKAVRHLKQRKFADETQILEALPEKEQLVRFLLDCVRNRFLLWSRVAVIKESLVEGSSGWQKAFDAVSRVSPYDTVDLQQPQKTEPQKAPTEKLPIPFVVEAAALFGMVLPLLALAQGCNCTLRWVLFLIGLCLCVPCIAFEFLWRCRRPRLLGRFLCGSYATKCEEQRLGCAWAPSAAAAFRKPPVDATIGRTWASYGHWFGRPPLAAGASIRAAGLGVGGESGSSTGASSSSDAEAGSGVGVRAFLVECEALRWASASMTLDDRGAMQGLSRPAEFDGDCIRLGKHGREVGETWSKLSWWRVELVRKALATVAILGLTMAVVAAAFYPNLTFNCGPSYNTTVVDVRGPIEVVFLLDASGSMTDQNWTAEQEAVKAVIDALMNVYSRNPGDVHVGLTQFSSGPPQVDVALTNELAAKVFSRLPPLSALVQKSGLTDYGEALKSCAAQLGAYAGAGAGAAKLCVMTTDGVCTTEATEQCADSSVLRAIVTSAGAEFVGIYIGSTDQAAEDTLTAIACGSATPCPRYLSGNLADIKSKAAAIAASLATLAQEQEERHDVVYQCDAPTWTLSGLTLWLPLVLWWLYHRWQRKNSAIETARKHKDPERLHAVAQNLGGGLAPVPAPAPPGTSCCSHLRALLRRHEKQGTESGSSTAE